MLHLVLLGTFASASWERVRHSSTGPNATTLLPPSFVETQVEGRICSPKLRRKKDFWWPGSFQFRGDPAELCAPRETAFFDEDGEEGEFAEIPTEIIGMENIAEGEGSGKSRCSVVLTNEKVLQYNKYLVTSTGKPAFWGSLPAGNCKMKWTVRYDTDDEGRMTATQVEWVQNKRCMAIQEIKVKHDGLPNMGCIYDYSECGLKRGTPYGVLNKCKGATMMPSLGFHWHSAFCTGDPHCVSFDGNRFKTMGVGEALITNWSGKKRTEAAITGCFFEPDPKARNNGLRMTFIKSASLQCGDYMMVSAVQDDLKFKTYYFNKDLEILKRRPAEFSKFCPRPTAWDPAMAMDEEVEEWDNVDGTGDHMAVEIMCTCQLTKTPAVNLRLSSDYAERTSVLDEKAFFSNETIMVTGDGELAILNIRIDHEPDERGRIANIEGGLCQQGRKFQSWIETGGKRPKRCKAWYPDAHDDQQDFATAECGPCGQYQAGPITAIGEKYPDLGIGCDAIACPLL